MPQPIVTFLACSLLLTPATLFAQGKGPAAPVAAEVFRVVETPMANTVKTVGTLRANESVDIVPELTKRLAKIQVHNPHFPALRSGSMALSRTSLQKQTSSQPAQPLSSFTNSSIRLSICRRFSAVSFGRVSLK